MIDTREKKISDEPYDPLDGQPLFVGRCGPRRGGVSEEGEGGAREGGGVGRRGRSP